MRGGPQVWEGCGQLSRREGVLAAVDLQPLPGFCRYDCVALAKAAGLLRVRSCWSCRWGAGARQPGASSRSPLCTHLPLVGFFFPPHLLPPFARR